MGGKRGRWTGSIGERPKRNSVWTCAYEVKGWWLGSHTHTYRHAHITKGPEAAVILLNRRHIKSYDISSRAPLAQVTSEQTSKWFKISNRTQWCVSVCVFVCAHQSFTSVFCFTCYSYIVACLLSPPNGKVEFWPTNKSIIMTPHLCQCVVCLWHLLAVSPTHSLLYKMHTFIHTHIHTHAEP